MARNKHPEETVNFILDTAFRLFMEKGYEHTSIQDIIDHLGGLSKGAIYHHFKSKEDILIAVTDRTSAASNQMLAVIRDREDLTGSEKLKTIFRESICRPVQNEIFTLAPGFRNNPRLLFSLLQNTIKNAAPNYILPIIRQGIADGSIHTSQPRALAEAIVLLSDIWINPIVQPSTREEIRARCAIYNQLFRGFGIEELIDEEIVRALEAYADMPRPPSPEGEPHA